MPIDTASFHPVPSSPLQSKSSTTQFNSGRTIVANNVRERPGYFQAVLETRSELVVPIRVGNVVVGVLNSEGKAPNHYSSGIATAVEQLAVAIGTALPSLGWTPGVSEMELSWVRGGPASCSA